MFSLLVRTWRLQACVFVGVFVIARTLALVCALVHVAHELLRSLAIVSPTAHTPAPTHAFVTSRHHDARRYVDAGVSVRGDQRGSVQRRVARCRSSGRDRFDPDMYAGPTHFHPSPPPSCYHDHRRSSPPPLTTTHVYSRAPATAPAPPHHTFALSKAFSQLAHIISPRCEPTC